MNETPTPCNTQTHAAASFDAWMGNPNIPEVMRESLKEVFQHGWNAALEVAELETWQMREDWENNPASLSSEKAKAAEEIGKVIRGLIAPQSLAPTVSKNAKVAGTPIVKSDGTNINPAKSCDCGGSPHGKHCTAVLREEVKFEGPFGSDTPKPAASLKRPSAMDAPRTSQEPSPSLE